MSELTKAAMDSAIAEHYADEMDGAIVSAYVLQIVGGSLDDYDAGQQSYFRCTAEGQPFVTTLGLAHYVSLRLAALATDDD